MSTSHVLLRTCAQQIRRRVSLSSDLVYTQSLQAAGLRLQHSTARPTSTQGVQQPGQADPFTSSLQHKTEKELLDQVLKQAQQEELAEEAAEQVSVCINTGDLMRHPVCITDIVPTLHTHCTISWHHNQFLAVLQLFLCLFTEACR